MLGRLFYLIYLWFYYAMVIVFNVLGFTVVAYVLWKLLLVIGSGDINAG